MHHLDSLLSILLCSAYQNIVSNNGRMHQLDSLLSIILCISK